MKHDAEKKFEIDAKKNTLRNLVGVNLNRINLENLKLQYALALYVV